MNHDDLASLFDAPVIEATEVDPGYDNANIIWEVRTSEGRFVVKIRKSGPEPETAFWDGLWTLFGLNVFHDLRYRELLSDFIQKHSSIEVPRVVAVDRVDDRLGHPYVITEYLPGEPADLQVGGHTTRLAAQLGDYLGCIHSACFDYWGCYPEVPRLEPGQWPEKLALTLEHMAAKWWAGNAGVQREVEERIRQARDLPAPRHFSLVFPDLRASQFLVHNGNLAALADVESQVLGPRELDFIALEYVLRPEDANSFLAAYTRHLPAPDLGSVRGLYRFLYFLIVALRESGFDEWMQAPAIFA